MNDRVSRHDSQKTRVTVTAVGADEVRTGRPGEACIVVIYGPELGRRVTLTRAAFEVGRSSKCDLFIDQESISRHHARITYEGDAYVIADLRSTNGTFVNDQPITQTRLRDGDQIQVGRSILKFMTGDNIEAHYHEEIYRLMTIDGLTQIFNRRYFDEALEREYNRSKRYQRDLSLILFDIDHFKSINDTHGHLAGDGLLRQLVTAVRQRVRREDIFARTGGEEFGVLLPEINLENARITAEKIRRIVEATPMRYEQTVVPCTISLGIAVLSADDATPQQLYERADQNLYVAKEGGRNRVAG